MCFVVVFSDEPKSSKDKKKKKKRGKKGRRDDSDEERAPRPMVKVGEGEMPEGAVSSEEEGGKKAKAADAPKDEVIAALDQNLDM